MNPSPSAGNKKYTTVLNMTNLFMMSKKQYTNAYLLLGSLMYHILTLTLTCSSNNAASLGGHVCCKDHISLLADPLKNF